MLLATLEASLHPVTFTLGPGFHRSVENWIGVVMGTENENWLETARQLEGTSMTRIEGLKTPVDAALDPSVISQVEVEKGPKELATPVASVKSVLLLQVQAEPHNALAGPSYLKSDQRRHALSQLLEEGLGQERLSLTVAPGGVSVEPSHG